ncbi:hypothetical protein GCM10007416_31680 [Kroppenstedtia guangzhouensis]|uniref:SWIM-type domain-containing protein n=1 Tax=Kroppenstedtia guangzhouensis TaxID=1274356 RepID=A0ABQ1H244_9BACL|nr:hypothetical protein GCM10007416_31680 [Kroppenstedtia guangzhouensis]
MITAAFTDGIALICVIPSQSKNGTYLVRVETHGNELIVTHHCPAYRFKHTCSHMYEAVASYCEWRWWERPKTVRTVCRTVILQPDWEQIPVPGSVQDTALQVMAGDAYAS